MINFIYINPPDSGLGDRLLDIILLYSYSILLKCSDFYVHWEYNSSFDKTRLCLKLEYLLYYLTINTNWDALTFNKEPYYDQWALSKYPYSFSCMHFKNWKECVEYYKNWQLRQYTKEGEDYYAFLVRIKYAQSKKYIECLKSLKVKTAKVNCNEK